MWWNNSRERLLALMCCWQRWFHVELHFITLASVVETFDHCTFSLSLSLRQSLSPKCRDEDATSVAESRMQRRGRNVSRRVPNAEMRTQRQSPSPKCRDEDATSVAESQMQRRGRNVSRRVPNAEMRTQGQSPSPKCRDEDATSVAE